MLIKVPAAQARGSQFNSQHTLKKLNMLSHDYNPNLGKPRKDSWGLSLLASWSWPVGEFQVQKKSVSKGMVKSNRGSLLASATGLCSYSYAHTHMDTRTHTHTGKHSYT